MLNVQEIKNWFIKKLGGITEEDHEKFRKKCVKFSDDYLKVSVGSRLVNSYTNIVGELIGKEFIVVGDHVRINNSASNSVIVAPWTKNCCVHNHTFYKA